MGRFLAWLVLMGIWAVVPTARSDEELGHIYCLSARTAISAKDFARAREQIKSALATDPGSAEALLLLGDIARAEGKEDEGRKNYAACVKALGARRTWTARDLEVRRGLTSALLPEEEQARLAELARQQAGRWLEAARQAAQEGSPARAAAAAELAATLDPQAARSELAAAREKAGAKEEAQSARWAAYLAADEQAPARGQARDDLLRLDKGWKALFDLETQLQGDWPKVAEAIRAKGGPLAGDLAALWSRAVAVVDEEWCSTRDPLADLTRAAIEWKGSHVLGKDGAPLVDLPPTTQENFLSKAAVVEALEIRIEGRTSAERPELDVSAQVGPGSVAWGKAGEEPKAPVWVLVRRLGSEAKAGEAIRFWVRYYPPKGIGVGTPLVDPRMRGASNELTLDKPLAASIRLESRLPRNQIEVTSVTLTLYLRPTK
jgi:hypothetical protein